MYLCGIAGHFSLFFRTVRDWSEIIKTSSLPCPVILQGVLRQQNIGEVAAGRRGWSYKKLLFYLSHPLSVENYCFFCFSPPIAMRHKGEKRKIYPYITKENVSLTPSHPYPVALQGILTHSSPAVSRNIAGYCGNRYKNNPYYSHTEMAVSS